jgi:hypothetical protein
LLYLVLLIMVCTFIFPFIVLYAFTSWIGDTWVKFSPSSKLRVNIEAMWDVIGGPYDRLVKLVG